MQRACEPGQSGNCCDQVVSAWNHCPDVRGMGVRMAWNPQKAFDRDFTHGFANEAWSHYLAPAAFKWQLVPDKTRVTVQLVIQTQN